MDLAKRLEKLRNRIFIRKQTQKRKGFSYKLSEMAFKLLSEISNKKENQKRYCQFSYDEMAKFIGCNKNETKKAMTELKDAKLIRCEFRGNYGEANKYHFL